MARGKKRDKYVSKGQRPNVRKDIRKAMRREYSGSLEQLLNKVAAWKKDRKVMLTISNPNKHATNQKFIKVSAKEVWGSPRPMKVF